MHAILVNIKLSARLLKFPPTFFNIRLLSSIFACFLQYSPAFFNIRLLSSIPQTCAYYYRDVMTFWQHDVLLTSWRTFWRQNIHVYFTSWCTLIWVMPYFDVMMYFWCHGVLLLFDVMACFYFLMSWRNFDVMTYFLTQWRNFDVMPYLFSSWHTFDFMTFLWRLDVSIITNIYAIVIIIVIYDGFGGTWRTQAVKNWRELVK